MPVLTIHHHEADGSRVVDLTWDDRAITVPFRPELDRFDLEDLRWYHENYRANWAATSESAVARIRRVQRKIGEVLHTALFAGDALPLAAQVRDVGPELRVKIHDEVYGAAVPWELIADPETGQPLVLQASSFVRTVGKVSRAEVPGDLRRVLMVISRPEGSADIGYWAVAYELWRALSVIPGVKLDVLRPPTFDALTDRLSEAAEEGAPYTAVHFDGHGVILDPFGAARHTGYLAFEAQAPDARGEDFVDGPTLGRVLAAAGVSLLSMNACRSGDTAGGDRHLRADPQAATGQPSLIEEVIAQGVPACVGMGREVYPDTPSRFFVPFYTAFLGGASAGEAGRVARRQLYQDPLTPGIMREQSAPVDDWSTPVIGERAVVHAPAVQSERQPDPAAALQNSFPEHLQEPPVVGFDRAILILEALFTASSVVVVHGPLLSGKSRLAVEYGKWLSDTTPTRQPVTYISLEEVKTPEEIAARIPADLPDQGGLLVLDQADWVSPAAQTFLTDALNRLKGTWRIIVTTRSADLPWLPTHERITPDVLPLGRRAELGSLWARGAGTEFDARALHPLVFFSGGFPGVLLLLLGTSSELISRGEATADDIAIWFRDAVWADIARLGGTPARVEHVVDRVVADISSRFTSDELAMIGYVARFHVCCDAALLARLAKAATGTDVSQQSAAAILTRLAATGLVFDAGGAVIPCWFLHPLFKLVASRLPQIPDARLDGMLIETIAETSAELSAAFRSRTATVVELLRLHKQNLHDALWLALESGRVESAAKLAEAVCLSCRYEGDVELSSAVLDRVLPLFIDTSTGALLPDHRDLALRVWDQAIWIGPDWPRGWNPRFPQRILLRPPDGDHYAAGLFHRALTRFGPASSSFLAAMQEPVSSPRYSPGDLEWYLTEIKHVTDPSPDFEVAIEGSRRSHAVRRADDAIGRASSRILEARIRVAMVFRDQEDSTQPLDLTPERLAELDEIADLLRDARAEPGGWSAENQSAADLLWSTILLVRGDLTSAVNSFEQSLATLMSLQERALVRHCWFFGLSLVRRGWVARGYEVAMAAFHFAMRDGDDGAATSIRQFCRQLEATYPELTS